MNTFLRKLLLFSLPVLLGGVLLEVFLRQIPNDYKLKNRYLAEHHHNIRHLVLGSSHGYYDITPQHLPDHSFNAAYISQSLDIDKMILFKYRDNLDHLETVILPISYFSLFSTIKSGKENWRLKNYILYYNLELSADLSYHTEILSGQLLKSLKKAFFYYFLDKSPITSSKLGHGIKFKKKDLKTSGIKSAERHTKKDLSLFKSNLGHLKNILQYCAKREVKVILFTPPAYESYYNHLNENQLSLTLKTCQKIDEVFPNCQYINYLNHQGFKRKHFFDGDHLNETGAKKLSKMISAIIQ